MIDLLCCFRHKNHPICLNKEFIWTFSDGNSFCPLGTVWDFGRFLVCVHLLILKSLPMLFVLLALVPSSVVSVFMACGLVPINCLQLASIAYKELFPVVIAAHLWGSLWSKQYRYFRSDNLAFVTIQLYRTSQVPALMHPLCD